VTNMHVTWGPNAARHITKVSLTVILAFQLETIHANSHVKRIGYSKC
jgi:hypothetical protein